MPRTADDQRGELPRTLLELRAKAGLRQVDVARRAGLTQTRLSRAENGHALLTPDEVETLARLYHAPEPQRVALVAAATAAQDEYIDARVVLQRGTTASLQRRFADLERRAHEVRAFQPVMVLGPLQTADYAAAVFGEDPDHHLVQQRLQRQRHLLDDPDRRWQLIQTEGALRWHVKSPALMAAQIEHLLQLAALPHVELGILAWATPVTTFPMTGFHLYDRRTVVVGTRDGTAIMTASDVVTDYRQLFDELRDTATFGEPGRDELRRILADYRSLAAQ